MNFELSRSGDGASMTRWIRAVLASAAGIAVLLGTASPVQADELDDRRLELITQISEQSKLVDHASTELSTARSALDAARSELTAAEARLKAAEEARVAAQELDAQRAQELEVAEHKLEQAKAEVAAAQAALDAVEARTNEEIIVITQQNGPILELALLVGDVSASALNQRAQLSTTLFDSSALELDELEARRIALKAAKVRADEAQAAAATAREAAAKQFAESVEKTKEADALKKVVADKVATRDASAAEAARLLEEEASKQKGLEAESADVDKRIAERVAAQKRSEEAAQKKAAEELAARQAAAKAASRNAAATRSSVAVPKKAPAKAPAPAAKSQSKKPQSKKPQAQTVKKPAISTSSSGFQRPVNGRLSSSYGMRRHPVLGTYKLHDGTDFAASCNTPIKAAQSGTVSERYFNGGYGNRLMVDHGNVNGSYVTTGYNHATRYTVSVGQSVSKGQVIGYVGSTGYSTGCHLHLMVWENGSMVNPMSKWFR